MKNRIFTLFFVVMLGACFLYACAGGQKYGAIGPHTGESGPVTVADLEANWGDYHIYYNTWHTANPAALMFDPKGNATKLTGDSWTLVKEQAAFSEMVKKITLSYSRARVLAIVGPDKQLLGYILTPSTQLYIKVVDENTFYVSNLRLPPSAP